MLLLAILALGVIGFQIGKAAILRSQAQTAADAAALAGRARDQAPAAGAVGDCSARPTSARSTRSSCVARDGRVRRGNGGRLDPAARPTIDGVDVRVWVESEEELGEDARDVDSRGRPRRRPRARHAVARRVDRRPGRRRRSRSAAAAGAIPDISDEEWDELGKQIGKPPLSCPEDVITLGLFLKSHGFQVWQNATRQLGGDAGHEDNPYELAPEVRRHGRARRQLRRVRRGCPSEMAALTRSWSRSRSWASSRSGARRGPLRPHAHRRLDVRLGGTRSASPGPLDDVLLEREAGRLGRGARGPARGVRHLPDGELIGGPPTCRSSS